MAYMALDVVSEVCSLLGKDFSKTLKGLRRVVIRSGELPALLGCYDSKFKPIYPHEVDDILLDLQRVTFDKRYWVCTLYKEDKNFVLLGFDLFEDAEERKEYHKSLGEQEVFILDLGGKFYENT